MEKHITDAYANPELLHAKEYRQAVEEAIALLDCGKLRVAEPDEDYDGYECNDWKVNRWVKQAIMLYFRLRGMETIDAGPIEYYDKIPIKRGYEDLGVRAVPPAVARYGAYLAPSVVLMPSYVNIGAHVGVGTMVDTWATVGSCAQIGEHVHLSGGVGIGGVLEPLQAAPVIIEDHCFIGSRAIIVEGVQVGREAVIAAGTVLTASTHIIDVTAEEPITYEGYVPPRSVVIPGSRTKHFPAGDYEVPCALIIGERKESTDLKTSLNEALRLF